MMMVLSLTPLSMAKFASDVTILDRKDISSLSDGQLINCYIDTLVEIEANQSYHDTSGFSAKEFKEYKDLLKYRILLLMEIHNRKLEVPRS